MVLDIYKRAFDYMVKNFADSILFVISTAVLGFLSIALPILGAIIYSYFYPNVVAWYYTKVTGENINPDYKTAFLSLLIPNLLFSIGITIILAILVSILIQLGSTFTNILNITNLQQLILMGLSNFHTLSYVLLGIVIGIIIIIVSGIIWLLLLYSIYGSILGKVNKLSIDAEKSLTLFAYWLLFYIIADIILLIIGKIPLLGNIIVIILNIMIVYPALNLILLLKAKEL